MTEPGEGKAGGGGRRAVREARLADKLRQNLVKRKAKVRAARGAERARNSQDSPQGSQCADVEQRCEDERES